MALVGLDMGSSYMKLKPFYENNTKFKLIGNGERLLTDAGFILFDGLIDRHTRIDIYAHGILDKQGRNYINLINTLYPTPSLFEMLAKSAMNDPLQIHLWSCNSSVLEDHVHYLPIGSVLVAHAQHDKPFYNGHANFGAITNLSFNNIFINLLDEYEKYLGHYIKVSVNLGKSISYETKQLSNMLTMAFDNPKHYAEYKLVSLFNALEHINQLADRHQINERAFASVKTIN